MKKQKQGSVKKAKSLLKRKCMERYESLSEEEKHKAPIFLYYLV